MMGVQLQNGISRTTDYSLSIPLIETEIADGIYADGEAYNGFDYQSSTGSVEGPCLYLKVWNRINRTFG